MKDFYRTHKKIIKLSLVLLFFIIIIICLWLFIVPTFKTNKYGDRLKDIKKHKISSEVINKIEDKAKDNESVKKVKYHREGRIINLEVIVDGGLDVNQAKDFGNSLLDEISEKDRGYYDIQVLIASEEKSDVYPIIGYKNKNSDGLNYGSAGVN